MQSRDLVNNARARGLLTREDADLLWAQSLSAPLMARVLLIHSRGSSLRAALSAVTSPVANDAKA